MIVVILRAMAAKEQLTGGDVVAVPRPRDLDRVPVPGLIGTLIAAAISVVLRSSSASCSAWAGSRVEAPSASSAAPSWSSSAPCRC